MLPDRVSNPGPLTYESDALPIALRGPAGFGLVRFCSKSVSVQVCSRGVQYITCIGRCRCIGMEVMLITCM